MAATEVSLPIRVLMLLLVCVRGVMTTYCSASQNVIQVCSPGTVTGGVIHLDTRDVPSDSQVECVCTVSAVGVQFITYDRPDILSGSCGMSFRYNDRILSCTSTTDFLGGGTIDYIIFSQSAYAVTQACLSINMANQASATVTCYSSDYEFVTPTRTTRTTTATGTPPTNSTVIHVATATATTTPGTTTSIPTTTLRTTAATTSVSSRQTETTTPALSLTTNGTTTNNAATTTSTAFSATTSAIGDSSSTTARAPTSGSPTSVIPTASSTPTATTVNPPSSSSSSSTSSSSTRRTGEEDSTTSAANVGKSTKERDIGIMIGIILGGLGGMIIVTALIIICIIKRKQRRKKPSVMTQYKGYAHDFYSPEGLMKIEPGYEQIGEVSFPAERLATFSTETPSSADKPDEPGTREERDSRRPSSLETMPESVVDESSAMVVPSKQMQDTTNENPAFVKDEVIHNGQPQPTPTPGGTNAPHLQSVDDRTVREAITKL